MLAVLSLTVTGYTFSAAERQDNARKFSLDGYEIEQDLLGRAILRERLQDVNDLLKKGVNPNRILITDEFGYGRTALMCIPYSSTNPEAIIDLIISYGADVNSYGTYREMPITPLEFYMAKTLASVGYLFFGLHRIIEKLHQIGAREDLVNPQLLETYKKHLGYMTSECSICLNSPKELIAEKRVGFFAKLPCCHQFICLTCLGLAKATSDNCPLCRRPIN